MNGLDDFKQVLSEFKNLSLWAAGASVVFPFIASFVSIIPPWPAGLNVITAIVQLVTLIVTYQTFSRNAQRITRNVVATGPCSPNQLLGFLYESFELGRMFRRWSNEHGGRFRAPAIGGESLRSGFDRDSLVYPIIFMYRQFVELKLKYLIFTFGRRVGVRANWKSHDIALLWSEFIKVLAGYGVQDPENTDSVVSAIVAEFAKVDPKSCSYRYPVDIHGQEIALGIEVLDLGALKDVMKGVEGYFTGCDGYLDHLAG
jgi:hypothetical protein